MRVTAGTYALSILDIDATSAYVYSKTQLDLGSFSDMIVVGSMNGDGASIVACLQDY